MHFPGRHVERRFPTVYFRRRDSPLDVSASNDLTLPVMPEGRGALVRALVAEFAGTFLIVLFGCGSVCSSLSGAYAGIWQVRRQRHGWRLGWVVASASF